MTLLIHPVSTQLSQLAARTTLSPLARAAIGVAFAVMTWDETYRSRQALKRLTTDDLRDIGMSRAQAQTEARRAFWDR